MNPAEPRTRWPWARWILRLLGPAVLIALLLTTDVAAVGRALADADLRWFLGAIAGWLLVAAVKAWRWRMLLAAQGIRLPYRQALRWYLAGLFLGGVSPGRLGELVKVTFIRDLGHAMGRALFSTVVDRMFDLLVLPAVVVAGMGLYGAAFSREIGVVAAAVGLAITGALILWKGRRLLAVPVRMLMPEAMRRSARLTVDDFLREFRNLRARDWALHGAVTAACWIVHAASMGLLAVALGLEVQPLFLGIAMLTAVLAGLAPITISGVGTRDAVLAAFFLREGLTTADAIALSTLILGLNLAVVALYLPAWQVSARERVRAEAEA